MDFICDSSFGIFCVKLCIPKEKTSQGAAVVDGGSCEEEVSKKGASKRELVLVGSYRTNSKGKNRKKFGNKNGFCDIFLFAPSFAQPLMFFPHLLPAVVIILVSSYCIVVLKLFFTSYIASGVRFLFVRRWGKGVEVVLATH